MGPFANIKSDFLSHVQAGVSCTLAAHWKTDTLWKVDLLQKLTIAFENWMKYLMLNVCKSGM